MAFTQHELAEHLKTLETHFWAHRRPPAEMRDEIREGQRIKGHDIDLFLIHPSFADPSRDYEESIAKIRYVRSRDRWKLYWMRADGKWHGYPPHREVSSLRKAVNIIHQDAYCCFFG